MVTAIVVVMAAVVLVDNYGYLEFSYSVFGGCLGCLFTRILPRTQHERSLKYRGIYRFLYRFLYRFQNSSNE